MKKRNRCYYIEDDKTRYTREELESKFIKVTRAHPDVRRYKIRNRNESLYWNYYVLKEDVKDFKPIAYRDRVLLDISGSVSYIGYDNIYYAEPSFNKEEILADHKAFVIKGSDWPYYFKHNGEILESKTSNWYKYLKDCYGYIADGILEEYNGPDKENEHIEK